jgi:glycosyltransferase involved in cell wall biosynthesis
LNPLSDAPLSGLRIAQLIESDGPGGAERVVAELAINLQRLGAESVVFVPADGEGWLAREMAGSGVAVVSVGLQRRVSPGCVQRIAAELRRRQIAVAHSHEFTMAVYGAWASRVAGIPHVITMHGGRYYAARWRRRLALRSAVAVSGQTVAVSDTVADRLRADLGLADHQVTTIANGVRFVPAPGSSLRDELHLADGDRLIVSVGNLYPVKGHSHLIDAFSMVSRTHPTLHLAIAGRGDLAASLAAQAAGFELGRRVHLLGLRSDIPAILQAADIFVLPSLSEGLPLALVEAMFAGCAIVASDVGEIGKMLAYGKAGVLVEPGNASQLAVAIRVLLTNPARARALGICAAHRAAAGYDISRMVDQYTTLYRSLARTALAPSDAVRRALWLKGFNDASQKES